MPGWHDATAKLQQAGKVRMVGILQEQHPDRARLFMQWKRMGWPLLVDSMNLLGVAVVPITILVDEHGVVRKLARRPGEVEDFLAETYEAPAEPTPPPRPAERAALRAAAASTGSAEDWRAYGQHLVHWGGAAEIDAAVVAFEKAAEKAPDDGATHFQLGVAYRHRYDSERRRDGDFQRAVDHWTRALDLDPNQYIWRRRIQQYGPRLDKPYPFYNWVEQARAEVAARGEKPVPLVVEPRGAELAEPARALAAADGEPQEPDPGGRIHRDERMIDVETVVVPAAIRPGEPARVHFVFRPDTSVKAHWNNEAEDMSLWVTPPAGWRLDRRFATVANPSAEVSEEARRIELELVSPEDATPGTVRLPAYALYYVCDDVDGKCLYRRQDVEVELPVAAPAGS